MAGQASAASACGDPFLVQVGRDVRAGLEERPSATAQSGNRFLSWPTTAVGQPLGVHRQRIRQTDLVDDPDVEADIHAQHAHVGEEHGVRGFKRPPVRRAEIGAARQAGTTSHWSWLPDGSSSAPSGVLLIAVSTARMRG